LPWLNGLPLAGFSFISGHLSKGPPSFRKLYSLGTTVLLPFCLYTVLDGFVLSYLVQHQPLYASNVFHSLMNASPRLAWYLQSLIVWRLIVWLCHQASIASGLPWWVWLICLSTTIFAASSFTPMHFWSLDNGIAFLPCFVVGCLFPVEELLAAVPMNVLTVLAGVISAIVWTLVNPRINSIGLPNKNLYESLRSLHGDHSCISALSWCEGMFGSLLFVTVFLTFLTMACPRGGHWFTECGKSVMYIYLLHAYVLQVMCWPIVAQHQQVFSSFASSSVVGTALIISVSLMIAVMLASKPVKWIFAPIIEPMSCLGQLSSK
jgi:fucose 4-O-acetylase-like acetyltransferase